MTLNPELTKVILKIDHPHFPVDIIKGVLPLKLSFMKESLLLQNMADTTTKSPAIVIPIWSLIKENSKQREEAPKMKAEKKMPLFYTEPIFKPKKHDFF